MQLAKLCGKLYRKSDTIQQINGKGEKREGNLKLRNLKDGSSKYSVWILYVSSFKQNNCEKHFMRLLGKFEHVNLEN